MTSWTITKDLIDGEEVGVIGPHNAPLDHNQIIEHPNHEKFKMYDDDSNLCYEGCIVGAEEGFEPLDDFGTPNAGCTRIDYWSPKNKKWETL